MTAYELIKACESVCAVLAKNNIKPADVRYLQLYADFVRMTSEGQKTSWVVYYLADQYGCDEATVYRVVKRLSAECAL